MSILKEIKKQQLQARKTKDSVKSSLLTCLISDIEILAKNDGCREVTDGDSIKIIKQYISGTKELIEILNKNLDIVNPKLTEEQVQILNLGYIEDLKDANIQLKILETFLPTQLTDEELYKTIDEIILIIQDKTIKNIFIKLDEFYKGLYDGKKAKQIIDSKI